MSDGSAELIVENAKAWSRWLERHGDSTPGVWLVLAKRGTTEPTALTYDEALAEALCFGWIDGQLSRRDDRTFRRRFSPRTPTSRWSKRNVDLAQRLITEGRMQPTGLATIEHAKANGSWEQAYAGQASIEIAPEFAAALEANAAARAMFDQLSGANRYAVLYRVATAKRPETRLCRIEQLVAMLARGETIHPQR